MICCTWSSTEVVLPWISAAHLLLPVAITLESVENLADLLYKAMFSTSTRVAKRRHRLVLRCEVWCVQGMQLKRDETLVGMSILPANVTSAAGAEGGATPMVLLVTAQGLGKRVPAEAFKLQHRAGMGNIAITCNAGDRLMALHVVCCVYPP